MRLKPGQLLDLLGFLLIALKLISSVDWSWWIVLAPFYPGFVFGLVKGYRESRHKTHRDQIT